MSYASVDQILEQIDQLPEADRLILEKRLANRAKVVVHPRNKSLIDLIGILKTDNPPNDSEVDRIVDEERIRKYG